MTYGCKENDKNKKQKLYAKALASFFALMLLFTVLSRAADSVAVAKVYAKKAKEEWSLRKSCIFLRRKDS